MSRLSAAMGASQLEGFLVCPQGAPAVADRWRSVYFRQGAFPESWSPYCHVASGWGRFWGQGEKWEPILYMIVDGQPGGLLDGGAWLGGFLS